MTAAVELRMPLGYVEMDAEEMEYLEGGKFYGVNLSKRQCQNLADNLTSIGGVLTISSLTCKAIAFIAGFQAALAGCAYYSALATGAGLSGWFFAEAAKRGGAYIGYESSTRKIVYGFGRY